MRPDPIPHLAFPKISTNAFAAATAGAPAGIWVAQEKVHGAQLVIGLAGDHLAFGKRKAWLGEAEPFFGWQLLRADLGVRARALREGLAAAGLLVPGDDVLYLYGELFGGQYPHPDVAATPGAIAVQTGVWYAPALHWCVFDAVVCPAGDARSGSFVGQRELARAAGEAGLLSPPVLGRGRRGELDGLAVRYPTRVPALLGLPALSDNWAEGLVVKPEGALPISARLVEKRKIAEFDELRFQESRAWDPDRPASVEELAGIAATCVNAARVASARSKVGDGDRAALLAEIVLDVLVDLQEALPGAFARLDRAAEARLEREIEALAAKILG